ncbi:hypothetical protein P872_16645 [Rhodonellum psychrophilum GCM71 = DSM 17998]|uniref:Uncharacterized protein n=1 Tax=Rhodonellum psychrophilum GCM71 = DSM 17998 TaxID=1123057 RepID=U5C531_9BACT|nr:hypothetical protein P872_16645 [Rhodonellum psychrophilum GCM71 = DSM 17998]
MSEVGSPKTEDRSWKTEDGRLKSDDRRIGYFSLLPRLY